MSVMKVSTEPIGGFHEIQLIYYDYVDDNQEASHIMMLAMDRYFAAIDLTAYCKEGVFRAIADMVQDLPVAHRYCIKQIDGEYRLEYEMENGDPPMTTDQPDAFNHILKSIRKYSWDAQGFPNFVKSSFGPPHNILGCMNAFKDIVQYMPLLDNAITTHMAEFRIID